MLPPSSSALPHPIPTAEKRSILLLFFFFFLIITASLLLFFFRSSDCSCSLIAGRKKECNPQGDTTKRSYSQNNKHNLMNCKQKNLPCVEITPWDFPGTSPYMLKLVSILIPALGSVGEWKRCVFHRRSLACILRMRKGERGNGVVWRVTFFQAEKCPGKKRGKGKRGSFSVVAAAMASCLFTCPLHERKPD